MQLDGVVLAARHVASAVLYHLLIVRCCLHAGLVQEVALRHSATNVVGRNVFQEIPLGQVLKYAGAAAGGAFAAAEVITGDGPKDALQVIKAAAKGAGLLHSGVAAVSQSTPMLQTALENIPSVGKVVATSIIGTIASSSGKHKCLTVSCSVLDHPFRAVSALLLITCHGPTTNYYLMA